jgi:hypothetical protein
LGYQQAGTVLCSNWNLERLLIKTAIYRPVSSPSDQARQIENLVPRSVPDTFLT